MAKGRMVGVMIDGARILTPGVLCRAMQGARLVERPVVYALGWHLGTQLQSRSTRAGYDQSVEDALLKQINWPADGYRLFEISTQAGNSRWGWLAPPGESNCIFVRREDFELLGGYDVLLIVDALDRGGAPGTISLLEPQVPDLAQWPFEQRQDFLADMHMTTPSRALILAKALGVLPPSVYLLGCQPTTCDDLIIGLSETVERAVALGVERLVSEIHRLADAHVLLLSQGHQQEL